MTMMTRPDTLTQRWMVRTELMEYIRVGSPHTLRKLIDDDGLPVHWLRNEMRFDRDEVDAWLRSRCIDPTPGATDEEPPA